MKVAATTDQDGTAVRRLILTADNDADATVLAGLRAAFIEIGVATRSLTVPVPGSGTAVAMVPVQWREDV
jgi:hypothetical protein